MTEQDRTFPFTAAWKEAKEAVEKAAAAQDEGVMVIRVRLPKFTAETAESVATLCYSNMPTQAQLAALMEVALGLVEKDANGELFMRLFVQALNSRGGDKPN